MFDGFALNDIHQRSNGLFGSDLAAVNLPGDIDVCHVSITDSSNQHWHD
jgi:hypothetical protein